MGDKGKNKNDKKSNRLEVRQNNLQNKQNSKLKIVQIERINLLSSFKDGYRLTRLEVRRLRLLKKKEKQFLRVIEPIRKNKSYLDALKNRKQLIEKKKSIRLSKLEKKKLGLYNFIIKRRHRKEKGKQRRRNVVLDRLKSEKKVRSAWNRYWRGLKYEKEQIEKNMTDDDRRSKEETFRYFVEDFKYAHNYETGFDRFWTELPFMNAKKKRTGRQRKSWYRSFKYKFFKNFEYLQTFLEVFNFFKRKVLFFFRTSKNELIVYKELNWFWKYSKLSIFYIKRVDFSKFIFFFLLPMFYLFCALISRYLVYAPKYWVLIGPVFHHTFFWLIVILNASLVIIYVYSIILKGIKKNFFKLILICLILFVFMWLFLGIFRRFIL